MPQPLPEWRGRRPGIPLKWNLDRRSEDLIRLVVDACNIAEGRNQRNVFCYRVAGVRIDLGGIAKGYAVDRAVTALRAAGCHGDASAALLETFGARVIKGPLHYRRRM